ncbi:hypothetical protein ACFLRC_03050 [Candidatus Altiarchaeota archaeon]
MVQIFKRRAQSPDSDVTKLNRQETAVHDELLKSLEKMKHAGVDRVVISLNEKEPDSNATGKWLSQDETKYYSYEGLCEEEKEMIKQGKSYTLAALVRENVWDQVKYDGPGVEVTNRTKINPLLPQLKAESELNYATNSGVYTGDEIRDFVKGTVKSGWTPELITKAVDGAITDYHATTIGLMEKAGVHESKAMKPGYKPGTRKVSRK